MIDSINFTVICYLNFFFFHLIAIDWQSIAIDWQSIDRSVRTSGLRRLGNRLAIDCNRLQSIDRSIYIDWQSIGNRMESIGNRLAIDWNRFPIDSQSIDRSIYIDWESIGNRLGIDWESIGNRLAIVWQSIVYSSCVHHVIEWDGGVSHG